MHCYGIFRFPGMPYILRELRRDSRPMLGVIEHNNHHMLYCLKYLRLSKTLTINRRKIKMCLSVLVQLAAMYCTSEQSEALYDMCNVFI